MNTKKINFISGLPRSGSTLLANILLQNPDVHATSTNGLADVMFNIRNQWDSLIEFQASPNDAARDRVLKAIPEAFYADVDKPIIFDKSRSWLSVLEMAERALGYSPKVLVPVRDITEILASFEILWRKTAAVRQMGQEQKYYFKFQTIEGRCDTWMQNNEPVGLAYNRVRDAVIRGHADKLFFVEFDALTHKPKETMEKIYAFLGEEQFEHDFSNVEQVTHENDRIHGIDDLHTIRKQVEPVEKCASVILGHAADPYKNLEFWRQLARQ